MTQAHAPAGPAALPPQPGLVTVALVVYNGREHVAAAIDSVLAQTYRPLELVVVDDGSNDGTWELLQSYGERLRAVRQPNGGLPVARNTALAHARGEFIALMDHDDICRPERIAVQVECLRRHPDVGLVCSDFSAFNEHGVIEPSHIATYYSQCSPSVGGVEARFANHGMLDLASVLPEAGAGERSAACHWGNIYDELAFGNFVHPPTVMVRASVVREAGPFDPAARNTCDWDWNVRVARVAQVAHVHRPLLDYRRSPGQMSGTQHRASANLVTLEVARGIFARDPVLQARHPRRARRFLGEMALDAAYANANARAGVSWRCLMLSCLRWRYVTGLTWRTLAKLLLPAGLASRRRRAKPA